MKLFLLIIVLFIFQKGYAQSIELQLISSAGSSGNSGIEWSTGETVTEGTGELTQGFHQGILTITDVFNFHQEFDVILYPNPTYNGLNIVSDRLSGSEIQLFDNSGILIKDIGWVELPHFLALDALPAGLYFVKVFSEGKFPLIFKVEKIH